MAYKERFLARRAKGGRGGGRGVKWDVRVVVGGLYRATCVKAVMYCLCG